MNKKRNLSIKIEPSTVSAFKGRNMAEKAKARRKGVVPDPKSVESDMTEDSTTVTSSPGIRSSSKEKPEVPLKPQKRKRPNDLADDEDYA